MLLLAKYLKEKKKSKLLLVFLYFWNIENIEYRLLLINKTADICITGRSVFKTYHII